VKRQDRKNLRNLKRKRQRHLARSTGSKAGRQPVLRGGNVRYEISHKVRGVASGGIAAIHEMVQAVGFDRAINASLELLKVHRPYWESDHILSLAYMIMNGGSCVEDLKACRDDLEFAAAMGACKIPDSTTAGDFLRRFGPDDIRALIQAALDTSKELWRTGLSPQERRVGVIDADGTIVATGAECMEGIEYSYKKQWGYAPLLVSLANINQPLAIVNRPGNAASSAGAAEWIDLAAAAVLEVFDTVLLRGDTDFSQCRHLDGWHEDGRIRFVFGFDACANLVRHAEQIEAHQWRRLTRPPRYEVKTAPRTRPERIKDRLVRARGWATMRLDHEEIAEFDYRPGACRHTYRMVVLRKTIHVTQGDQEQFLPVIRHFFYITNDRLMSAPEVVREANQRCNQENLIAQLAGQVQALSPAANTLDSNGAWMAIASLAWVFKNWYALMMPDPAEAKRVQAMEFKGFVLRFVHLPAQVIRTGRRIVVRIIGGCLDSLESFFATLERIRRLKQIRA
jgi:hypothetical protein